MTAPPHIISGGQTGVDRAALDAALAAGLAVGGACPKGRLAEDGPIPARYPLTETESADPAERTRTNVRAADATLIVVDEADPARWGPGTRLTVATARALGRPVFVAALGAMPAPAEVAGWMHAEAVGVLNVAGSRESEAPGIHARARVFLDALFAVFASGQAPA